MNAHTPDMDPFEHEHAHTLTDVQPAGETRWWKFVEETTRGAKQTEIAARADIDQSHISRWYRGYPPSVQFVTRFARAYGVNVQQALVEAGMITEEEADLHTVVVTSFADATKAQLLEELDRRLGGD